MQGPLQWGREMGLNSESTKENGIYSEGAGGGQRVESY